MKTITQVAKETGVTYERVIRTVRNLEMVLITKKLNEFQEEVLLNTLFHSGFFEELTLESKMNIPETFEEFKNKTYENRKNNSRHDQRGS